MDHTQSSSPHSLAFANFQPILFPVDKKKTHFIPSNQTVAASSSIRLL